MTSRFKARRSFLNYVPEKIYHPHPPYFAYRSNK